MILPYLEQDNLARAGYGVYSLRDIRVYACPSDPHAMQYYPGNREYGKLALTDYLAVTGTTTFVGDPTTGLPRPPGDGVIYESSRTRISDIRDGTSNTVLVGERPPSPNLFWGWWSWYAFDASLGVRNIWPVFPDSGTLPYVYCPSLFPENYRAAHDRQLRHAPLLEYASRWRQLAVRRRLGAVLALCGERDFAGPGHTLRR